MLLPFGGGTLDGTFGNGCGFRIVRYFERGIPHLFADGTGSDALGTGPDSLGCSICSGRPNIL